MSDPPKSYFVKSIALVDAIQGDDSKSKGAKVPAKVLNNLQNTTFVKTKIRHNNLQVLKYELSDFNFTKFSVEDPPSESDRPIKLLFIVLDDCSFSLESKCQHTSNSGHIWDPDVPMYYICLIPKCEGMPKYRIEQTNGSFGSTTLECRRHVTVVKGKPSLPNSPEAFEQPNSIIRDSLFETEMMKEVFKDETFKREFLTSLHMILRGREEFGEMPGFIYHSLSNLRRMVNKKKLLELVLSMEDHSDNLARVACYCAEKTGRHGVLEAILEWLQDSQENKDNQEKKKELYSNLFEHSFELKSLDDARRVINMIFGVIDSFYKGDDLHEFLHSQIAKATIPKSICDESSEALYNFFMRNGDWLEGDKHQDMFLRIVRATTHPKLAGLIMLKYDIDVTRIVGLDQRFVSSVLDTEGVFEKYFDKFVEKISSCWNSNNGLDKPTTRVSLYLLAKYMKNYESQSQTMSDSDDAQGKVKTWFNDLCGKSENIADVLVFLEILEDKVYNWTGELRAILGEKLNNAEFYKDAICRFNEVNLTRFVSVLGQFFHEITKEYSDSRRFSYLRKIKINWRMELWKHFCESVAIPECMECYGERLRSESEPSLYKENKKDYFSLVSQLSSLCQTCETDRTICWVRCHPPDLKKAIINVCRALNERNITAKEFNEIAKDPLTRSTITMNPEVSDEEFDETMRGIEEKVDSQAEGISLMDKYGVEYNRTLLEAVTVRDLWSTNNDPIFKFIQSVQANKRSYSTTFCYEVFRESQSGASARKLSPNDTLICMNDSMKFCRSWLKRTKNEKISVKKFEKYSRVVTENDAEVLMNNSWVSVSEAIEALRRRISLANLGELLVVLGVPEENEIISRIKKLKGLERLDEVKREVANIDKETRLRESPGAHNVLEKFEHPKSLLELMEQIHKMGFKASDISTALSMSRTRVSASEFFIFLGKLSERLSFLFNLSNWSWGTLDDIYVRLRAWLDDIHSSKLCEDLSVVISNIGVMISSCKELGKSVNESNFEKIGWIARETTVVNMKYNGDYSVLVHHKGEFSDTEEFLRPDIEDFIVTSNLVVELDPEPFKTITTFKLRVTKLRELSDVISTSMKRGFCYFCKRRLIVKGSDGVEIKLAQISEYLDVVKEKISKWENTRIEVARQIDKQSTTFNAIPSSLIFYILYSAAGGDTTSIADHILNINNYLISSGLDPEAFMKKLEEKLTESNMKMIVLTCNEDIKSENIEEYAPLIRILIETFTEPSERFQAPGRQHMEGTNINRHPKTPPVSQGNQIVFLKVPLGEYATVMNRMTSSSMTQNHFFETLYCNRRTDEKDVETFITCCFGVDGAFPTSEHRRLIVNPNSLETKPFKMLAEAVKKFQISGEVSLVTVQLEPKDIEELDRDFENVFQSDNRTDVKTFTEHNTNVCKHTSRLVEIVRSEYCGEGKSSYISRKSIERKAKNEDLEYVSLNIMDADDEVSLIKKLQEKCSNRTKSYDIHIILSLSFGKTNKFLPFIYQLLYLPCVHVNGTIFCMDRVTCVYIECRESTYNLADLLGEKTTDIKYDFTKVDTSRKVVELFVKKQCEIFRFQSKKIEEIFKSFLTVRTFILGSADEKAAEEPTKEFLAGLHSYSLLKMYMKIMNMNSNTIISFIEFLKSYNIGRQRTYALTGSQTDFSRFLFRVVMKILPINSGVPSMKDLSTMKSFGEMAARLHDNMKTMQIATPIIWVSRNNSVFPPIIDGFDKEKVSKIVANVLGNCSPINKIESAEYISGVKDSHDLSKLLFKELCWAMGRSSEFFANDYMNPHGGWGLTSRDKEAAYKSAGCDRFEEWNENGDLKNYRLKDKAKEILEEYVFTIDNTIKMLFIYLKMINRLPVVLIGETGVGKTELLKKLQVISGLNIKTLQVHSETTAKEIHDVVFDSTSPFTYTPSSHRPEMAYRYVFFDEANTSPHIQRIEELVVSRTFEGKKVPKDISFLVAVNPYRTLNEQELHMYEGFKNPRHRENRMAYTVRQLPISLQLIAFNFGQLKKEAYMEYAKCVIKNIISLDDKAKDLAISVIETTKDFMDDNNLIISLRELDRFKALVNSFIFNRSLFEGRGRKLNDKWEGSVVLVAAYIVFALRFPIVLRKQYTEKVKTKLDNPWNLGKVYSDVRKRCLDNFVIPPGIAQNEPFKNNLFLIVIAILTRIPLIIMGKPGSSKSLAASLLDVVAGTKTGKTGGEVWFPPITVYPYQGSESSTSGKIMYAHGQAVRCAQLLDKVSGSYLGSSEHITVFQFDEIGLAEQGGKRNSLKCLHFILEIKNKEHQLGGGGKGAEFRNPAFIGLSNYALDQAKTNRCLTFCVDDLTESDLKLTAREIFNPGKTNVRHTNKDLGSPLNRQQLLGITSGFLECLEEQKRRNFNIIGLRNYYSLISDISDMAKSTDSKPLTRSTLAQLIQKSFGVFTGPNFTFDPYTHFSSQIFGDIKHLGPDEEWELVEANLKTQMGRHIMLLVDDISSVHNIINIDTHKSQSTLIMPTNLPNFIPSSIQKIIGLMDPDFEKSNGRQLVFMLKSDEVYPSLFSLLNKNYSVKGGRSTVNIALDGSSNQFLFVSSLFRIIAIMFQDDVKLVDPAFVNRFELRNVTTRHEIARMEREDRDKLEGYVQLLEGASNEVYKLLGTEKSAATWLSPFYEKLDIHSTYIFSLVKKHGDPNDPDASAKLLDELIMSLYPKVRVRMKGRRDINSKQGTSLVNVIPLSSALELSLKHLDSLTPITIILVDVFKSAKEVSEFFWPGEKIHVFSQVVGENADDPNTLLGCKEDKSVVRILVPDYTKSIHLAINLATLQFYKQFGSQYRLIIIAKVNDNNLANLYPAPSHVMSYWCVSSDYDDNPIYDAVYTGEKVGNRSILFLLPKAMNRVFGVSNQAEKQITYDGIRDLLSRSKIDVVPKTQSGETTVSQDGQSPDTNQEVALDKIKERSKELEIQLLEVTETLLQKIWKLGILLPTGSAKELGLITKVFSDKQLEQQIVDAMDPQRHLDFCHPFLYNLFKNTFVSTTTDVLFETLSKEYTSYFRRLAVAFVVREIIAKTVIRSVPVELLSGISPDSISQQAYANMYTIISRSLGGRSTTPPIKLAQYAWEKNSYEHTFRFMSGVFDILFETKLIEDPRLMSDLKQKNGSFMRSVIEKVFRQDRVAISSHCIGAIRPFVNSKTLGIELVKVEIANIFERSGRHKADVWGATSLEQVVDIVKGAGEDFPLLMRLFLQCLKRWGEKAGEKISSLTSSVAVLLVEKLVSSKDKGSKTVQLLSLLKICFAIAKKISKTTQLITVICNSLNNRGLNMSLVKRIVGFILVSVFDLSKSGCDEQAVMEENVSNAMDVGLLQQLGHPKDFAKTISAIVNLEMSVSEIVRCESPDMKLIMNIAGNDVAVMELPKKNFLALVLKFALFGPNCMGSVIRLHHWIKDKLPDIANLQVLPTLPPIGALDYNPFNLAKSKEFDMKVMSYNPGELQIHCREDRLAMACAVMYSSIAELLDEVDKDDFRKRAHEFFGKSASDSGSQFPATAVGTVIKRDNTTEMYVRAFINICNIIASDYRNGAGRDSLLTVIMTSKDTELEKCFVPCSPPSSDEVDMDKMLSTLKGLIICGGTKGKPCEKIIRLIDDPFFVPNSLDGVEMTCPSCNKRNSIPLGEPESFLLYLINNENLEEGIKRVRDASRFAQGISTDEGDIWEDDKLIWDRWGTVNGYHIICAVTAALRYCFLREANCGSLLVRIENSMRHIADSFGGSVEHGLSMCLKCCEDVVKQMSNISIPKTQVDLIKAEKELVKGLRDVDDTEKLRQAFPPVQRKSQPKDIMSLLSKIRSEGSDPVQSFAIRLDPLATRELFNENGWFCNWMKDKTDGRATFLSDLGMLCNKNKCLRYLKVYMTAVKMMIAFMESYNGVRREVMKMMMDQFLDSFQEQNKRNRRWFETNEKRIVSFFRLLREQQNISTCTDGEFNTGVWVVPEFCDYKTLPFSALYPLAAGEGDENRELIGIGYYCVNHCVRLHNKVLELFNRCVQNKTTFGQLHNVTQTVTFDAWVGSQMFSINMDRLLKRDIVRYVEDGNLREEINLKGMEEQVVDKYVMPCAIVDKSSLSFSSDLGRLNFNYHFQRLSEVSKVPFGNGSNSGNKIIRLLKCMTDPDKLKVIDECIKIIYGLSDMVNELNADGEVPRHLYSSESNNISKVFENMTIEKIHGFYKYIEREFGHLYINKYCPELFKDEYNGDFKEVEEKHSIKSNIEEEVTYIKSCVNMLLIRECIPLYKSSNRRPEMVRKLSNDKKEVQFTYYIGEGTNFDSKHANLSDPTCKMKIMDIIRKRAGGESCVTIYNMYSMASDKLSKLIVHK